jgi:t-SNARE complex subunit (syntaxin)
VRQALSRRPDTGADAQRDLAALRLAKQFRQLKEEYETAVVAARRSLSRSSEVESGGAVEEDGVVMSPQLQALLDQVEADSASVDQMLIEEQNADVAFISQQLSELTEVYADTASIVGGARGDLEYMETANSATAHRTRVANRSIRDAASSSRSARRKRRVCCVFLSLLFVAAGLAVAVGHYTHWTFDLHLLWAKGGPLHSLVG